MAETVDACDGGVEGGNVVYVSGFGAETVEMAHIARLDVAKGNLASAADSVDKPYVFLKSNDAFI